jgi:nucleoside-diphosphate-sugar epimerase
MTHMAERVFLAGAAGAIGARLVPLLLEAGFDVLGTTRSQARAAAIRAAGAQPVVVDVFDAEALTRAMLAARPSIVIHQLTDLAGGFDAAAIARNARLREEGTRNLVAAAIQAGAGLLVAQSIAWAYAPGPEPHAEADPLDVHADGRRGVTVGGVAALERLTLESPPLSGIVLRYGWLYGPGTGVDEPPNSPPLHVDAAASAALVAVRYRQPDVFNIAEASPHLTTDKARQLLGWQPDFRLAPLST